jgi:hypothetical protein
MQEEVEFKNKVLLVLGCKNLKGKVEFQLGLVIKYGIKILEL